MRQEINQRGSLGFGRGSRVEGTKSRVEGNMSRVEGNMSRVLKNENKIIKIKIKKIKNKTVAQSTCSLAHTDVKPGKTQEVCERKYFVHWTI